ncbi:hypothetical protein ABW20_dc0108139 [Dactylellina cionopaga]|nr:hypothetical protein ABW20_dc0108139 [Dactylellina cionopaga]
MSTEYRSIIADMVELTANLGSNRDSKWLFTWATNGAIKRAKKNKTDHKSSEPQADSDPHDTQSSVEWEESGSNPIPAENQRKGLSIADMINQI